MELWLELGIKIGLRNGVGVKRVKRFRMFEDESQSRALLGTGFVVGGCNRFSCQR